MDNISITDFQKMDIRMGKVISVSEVEQSDKLLRLEVDFGELGTKTVFAGIKKQYSAKDLEGKILPFVYNIQPRKMPFFKQTSQGEVQEESQAMLMAAEDENICLLFPEREIVPGSKIY